MPRKYRSFAAAVLVGDERIELPQVESESTALPLCKSPSVWLPRQARPAADKGYYTQTACRCQLFFSIFFSCPAEASRPCRLPCRQSPDPAHPAGPGVACWESPKPLLLFRWFTSQLFPKVLGHGIIKSNKMQL